ncbi:MAG: long-chain fatty acid--CoA ligase [Gemmatimonadaceae bacterium]|nr:long-chain fatty acid--CoA ligase [Gemmatimonadaceae bacterium]NUQ94313.1 long-chain fatty acid--CoA ligase [Gemmatimonadaceae bacterium]NUR20928.1 long-chain fatty acid--CoA ligase [Gemmatimonadaceae bacterium]NUS96301.1 long-chain fatty acid--CoA ligase [Gemmatimonadaceae bacterium]
MPETTPASRAQGALAAAAALGPITSGGPRVGQPGTIPQLFYGAVEKHDRPDALLHKTGGEWKPISHRTLLERVARCGRGLRAIGVQPGDRVGILSENRPEWAIADYACLTSGVIDVALYPNLPPDQIAYILRDSGAAAVFVSTAAQAAKVAEARKDVPSVKHVISFTSPRPAGADMTIAELEARGAEGETAESMAAYRADAMRAQPDDVATLIYTSGTTGEPKGVMLTHDNFYSNVLSAVLRLDVAFLAGASNLALSFLPLSHVFERMVGHFTMMHTGTTIAYAESMDTVPVNMQEVKPTIVASVPRLYEKMYARVLENALAGGAVKKRIFFWARRAAERWADVVLAGRRPNPFLALQYRVAQKLVFSKLKARTGGRLRYFVSGGAPLSPEINKFFYAAGLTILEGYGLTETSPVICCNTPSEFRIGTVGRPIPGVEVAIAGDGEIVTRGPHVMKGYWNKPEATRDAIDAEGWFHTGDIGELRDGFLAITDRKKDLIVTAGGKKVAPQPIENMVKTNKYVSQAIMLGDKRKFPSMLIVPNFEQLEKWAKYKNLMYNDHRQLIAMPIVQAKMEKEVLGRTSSLANFEQPKKIALLDRDLTVEHGEMTPTLKVRRKIVEQRYRDVIESMYEEGIGGQGSGVG